MPGTAGSAGFTPYVPSIVLRSAGLIGAAAGYGMYLASLEASSNQSFDAQLKAAGQKIITTRPTAVNLKWAVDRQLNAIKKGKSTQEKIEIAKQTAQKIANEDVEYCRKIGALGLRLIQDILSQKNKKQINILTH